MTPRGTFIAFEGEGNAQITNPIPNPVIKRGLSVEIRDVVRLPAMPEFALWCGTRLTEDWHCRFRAETVVMGHLHLPGVLWRDGVPFEEVSLGYPQQWERRGQPAVPREVAAAGRPVP